MDEENSETLAARTEKKLMEFIEDKLETVERYPI